MLIRPISSADLARPRPKRRADQGLEPRTLRSRHRDNRGRLDRLDSVCAGCWRHPARNRQDGGEIVDTPNRSFPVPYGRAVREACQTVSELALGRRRPTINIDCTTCFQRGEEKWQPMWPYSRASDNIPSWKSLHLIHIRACCRWIDDCNCDMADFALMAFFSGGSGRFFPRPLHPSFSRAARSHTAAMLSLWGLLPNSLSCGWRSASRNCPHLSVAPMGEILPACLKTSQAGGPVTQIIG